MSWVVNSQAKHIETINLTKSVKISEHPIDYSDNKTVFFLKFEMRGNQHTHIQNNFILVLMPLITNDPLQQTSAKSANVERLQTR